MDNSRRTFLKGAGAALGSFALPMTLSMRTAHAVTAGKKLIVFNMRGGNDGLNTIVPTGVSPLTNSDQTLLYHNYRPDIHIPEADLLNMAIPNSSASEGEDISGQTFRMHPALSALQPYLDRLAIFPATHSSVGTVANRSHFFQMDLYGAGMHDLTPAAPDSSGWIGRYFDTMYSTQPFGIIGHDFTAGSHGTVQGERFVLQLSDPSNINLGAPGAITDEIWQMTKNYTDVQAGTVGGDYHDHQKTLLDDMLSRLGGVWFERPENATYPNSQVGRDFKRAADMLLDLPELEVVHIDMGGFDTHNNQIDAGDRLSGRQANLLSGWSQAFAAFYEDLAIADPALKSNVVITVQTEFGRTINQNGNMGTDHGNASCWMAFGDPVKGGIYGSYPSIDAAELNGNNWLKPTIDYRDIFSEVLGPKHMGLADGGAPFPGYSTPASPLDFIL